MYLCQVMDPQSDRQLQLYRSEYKLIRLSSENAEVKHNKSFFMTLFNNTDEL